MEIPFLQPNYAIPPPHLFPFFFLCSVFQLPTFALFAAAWTIDESGILSINRYGSAELQAAGKWFLAFLKSYAGIGVIISLYQYTFYIASFQGHFSTIIFPAVLPLLGTVLVIPAIMLVAATEGRRRDYILGYVERLGIRNEFELSVRRIDESQ